MSSAAFSQDKRVLAWETWNEPLERSSSVSSLVEASFALGAQGEAREPVSRQQSTAAHRCRNW